MLTQLRSAFRTRRPTPARKTPVRMTLDQLHARDVPAVLTWVGPAGGHWSNSANWSSASGPATPTALDNLQFGTSYGGTNTSSVNDVSSLTVAVINSDTGFTGAIDVGTLSVGEIGEFYGALDITGGDHLSGGNMYLYGHLNIYYPDDSHSYIFGNGANSLDVSGTLYLGAGSSTLVDGDDETYVGIAAGNLLSIGGSTMQINVPLWVTGDVSLGGDTTIENDHQEGAWTALTVNGSMGVGGTLTLARGVNGSTRIAVYTDATEDTVGDLGVGGTINILGTEAGIGANITLTGSITVADDEYQDGAGTLFCGNLDVSSGTLTLRDGANLWCSDYTQFVGTFECGTGSYIHASGDASLSGQLHVSGSGTIGGEYDIIYAHSISGDFTNTEFPDAPAGHDWTSGTRNYPYPTSTDEVYYVKLV